jgi:hypothetical protein
MAVRQQQRRGTAAQWTSANPILSPGEIGFEIDTNKFKIGDGTTRWVSLIYFTADAAAALEDLIDGAPGLLNTLNELAAAVGDDANFFSTVTTNIATAKSEAISTAATDATTKVASEAALRVSGDSASVSTASADATTKADAAKSFATAADATLRTAVTTDIATAKSEAIGTSALDATAKANAAQSAAEATASTDAQSRANAAQSAAEATAAAALSTHESDTAGIHGIADTSELATKTFAANLLTGAAKTNITISGDKNGLTITAENGVADSTTDDLAQGATNKYFSNALAVTAIQNAMNDKSFEAMIDGGGV